MTGNWKAAAQTWLHRWAGPLLAVAGTLLFYHRLLHADLILIKRDAVRFFLPLKQYMAERLLAGELPQWFPYEGLGRSFLGSTVTGVFHPFTLLYLVFPAPAAYRLSTLCACVLAAVGGYALGRQWQYARAGALAAGLVFALSGYVASLTENIVYLYSVCLLPLFCAALEQALRRRAAWIVAPACLWATVWLNGDAQTGYYYGGVALLWGVARRGDAPWRTALRLLSVAGLAGLLAGVQLAVSVAEFLESARAQGELFQAETMGWSTHPLRLLTMAAGPVGSDETVVPVAHYFFGSAPAGGSPVGYWAESLYLGLPVLGLAALGAWVRRDLRLVVLLGGLAMLLALGRYGGLYALCSHIVPLWSAFRYPEKLMGVATFAIAMLAGAGMDAVRQGRWTPVAWLSGAACAACLGVALTTVTMGDWAAATFQAPPSLAREVTRSAGMAWLFSAAAALAVGLLLLAFQKGALRGDLLLGLLLMTLALDLSRVNLHAYRTGPLQVATATPGLVEAVWKHAGHREPGRFRILTTWDAKGAARYPTALADEADHYGLLSMRLRQGVDVEHNAQFHLESMKAYLPGFNPALAGVVSMGSLDPRAYARFNVAYFLGPRDLFSALPFAQTLVAYVQDFDLVLVGNPAPLTPRVYFSRRPEPAMTAVEVRALVSRQDFLEGDVDIIETLAELLPPGTRAGDATIERYAPEEVRVEVDVPQTALLVLADGYARGWSATLDAGTDVPILRANGFVRAVVVPAGRHAVTFSYETPGLVAGAAATATGVLACAVLLGCARRRHHLRASPTSLPDRMVSG